VIYSNIMRLHPSFDLDEVLEDLSAPLSKELTAKVHEHVGILQEAYSRVDKPAGGNGSGDAHESAEGNSAA
jgi:hypothetical protein